MLRYNLGIARVVHDGHPVDLRVARLASGVRRGRAVHHGERSLRARCLRRAGGRDFAAARSRAAGIRFTTLAGGCPCEGDHGSVAERVDQDENREGHYTRGAMGDQHDALDRERKADRFADVAEGREPKLINREGREQGTSEHDHEHHDREAVVARRPRRGELLVGERAGKPGDQPADQGADQRGLRVLDRALQLRDDVDRVNRRRVTARVLPRGLAHGPR